MHDPEHCDPVHAPLAHAWAAPQLPVGSQVWRPVPMHRTAPGSQLPWHAAVPDVTTQALPVQTTEVPQLPLALHVCTPLP